MHNRKDGGFDAAIVRFFLPIKKNNKVKCMSNDICVYCLYNVEYSDSEHTYIYYENPENPF